MTKICRFDASFSQELNRLFGSLKKEIEKHGDVLKETISVAVDDGILLGICFLTATSSYRYADREHPGYLNMNFEVIPGENEVEVSALLIDTLIKDYKFICKKEKNKRIILRTFCSASSNEYLSFLTSFGFRAHYFMYRMKKDLTGAVPVQGNGDFEFDIFSKDRKRERISVRTIRAGSDGSIDGLEDYFEANGRAFGIPDSENELEFRLKEQNGVQFIARAGDKLVAAVSVWENGRGSVSTENIFCSEEYRRCGVTEKMLRGVSSYLAGKGYREATLFVYGVNTFAVALYTKLGYNIYGGLLHMLYEEDYIPEII